MQNNTIHKWLKNNKTLVSLFIVFNLLFIMVAPFSLNSKNLEAFIFVLVIFNIIFITIGAILHILDIDTSSYETKPNTLPELKKQQRLLNIDRHKLDEFRELNYKYHSNDSKHLSDLDNKIDTHNWIVNNQHSAFVCKGDFSRELSCFNKNYYYHDMDYFFCECADCGSLGFVAHNVGVIDMVTEFKYKYPNSVTADPDPSKRDCQEQKEWNKYIAPMAEMLDKTHAYIDRIDSQKKDAEKQKTTFKQHIPKIESLGSEYKKASESVLKQLKEVYAETQNKITTITKIGDNLNRELRTLRVEFKDTCNAFDIICQSQKVLREAQIALDSNGVELDNSNQLSQTVEQFRNDIYAALGRIEADLATIPESNEDELIKKFRILEQNPMVRVELPQELDPANIPTTNEERQMVVSRA
jgi:DNA repair exonuclease SbcCD ATPase subunit